MRKVFRKGKVNGFEASYAFPMLRMIFLNVVHGVHGYGDFSGP